jgi:effector-binding domain-containing protein
MCHDNEMVERDITLEVGCLVEVSHHAPVVLPNGLQLCLRSLPAVPMMASTVIAGSLEMVHAGYSQLGLWIRQNGYQMAGLPREITLRTARADIGDAMVTELQIPVQPVQV